MCSLCSTPVAVLLVDDHHDLRRRLAQFLRLRGCVVEEAADGIEGLAALDRRPFDVVVSDLAMPRLDGAGLWIQASGRHPDQAARWIVVSSEPLPTVLAEAGLTYLPKPYDLEDVWVAVRLAADGR